MVKIILKISYLILITLIFVNCEKINSNRGKILFVGDSHINRWDLNYFFPGFSIENKGIGGATIAELTEMLSEEMIEDYDKIFVEIGTNDIRKGIRGGLTDLEMTEEFTEEYELLAFDLSNIDSEVFFISLIAPGRDSLGERANKIYSDLNVVIENIAQNTSNALGIQVFDLTKDVQGYLKPHFTNDELHLNNIGYEVLSRKISEYVY